ncbi:MAG TPA: hypothetical protein VIM42_07530 [Clostridium sp.]
MRMTMNNFIYDIPTKVYYDGDAWDILLGKTSVVSMLLLLISGRFANKAEINDNGTL